MRTTTSIGTLTLALVLGAGALAAQPPRDDGPPRESADSTFHGRRGPGGPGGPQGTLLRGITLTDAQRQRVSALRSAERDRDIASLRGVLTAGQRRTFDANVAEMKRRDAERRERGDNDGPRREARDGGR